MNISKEEHYKLFVEQLDNCEKRGFKPVPAFHRKYQELFADYPDLDWDALSLSDVITALRKVQPPGNVNKPAEIKRPAAITSNINTDRVNAASVCYRALRENARFKAVFQAIAPGLKDHAEKDVKETLTLMLRHMQPFSDAHAAYGSVHDISEAEYAQWLKNRNGATLEVGPYLLIKLLYQANVTHELFYTNEETKEYPIIVFHRNGLTLESHDKFHIMTGDGNQNLEYYGKFLKGLKAHKKQLVYRPVSTNAYRATEMFMFQYDVRYDSQQRRTECTAPKQRPPYPADAQEILARVASSNLTGVVGKSQSQDITWDRVAAHIDKILDGDDFNKLSAARDWMQEDCEINTRPLRALVAKSASMNDKDKVKALTELGLARTCTEMRAQLIKDRNTRNRAGVADLTQYIQKNVGSVHGPEAPQFVDTMMKAAAIIKWCEDAGIDMKGKVISNWGIAYDHMGGAIQHYLPENTVLKYDILKAKDSPAGFTYGNIVDWAPATHDPANEIVIDDTWLHSIRQQTLTKMKPDLTKDNIELTKLARFLAKPVGTAFIKMNLMYMDTPALTSLLFPNGKPNKLFYHISVQKFGKLHNEEVFLVLSRDKAFAPKPGVTTDRLKRTLPWYNTYVLQANMCVSLANLLIMTFNEYGLRFRPNGGARVLWQQVIKLLPQPYTHYLSLTVPKANPIRGGTHSVIVDLLEKNAYAFDEGQEGDADYDLESVNDDFDYDDPTGEDDDDGALESKEAGHEIKPINGMAPLPISVLQGTEIVQSPVTVVPLTMLTIPNTAPKV